MPHIYSTRENNGEVITMIYISGKKQRCVTLATFLIQNKATVRSVAKSFGISKSTVHKDITKNLKKIDLDLYKEVQEILETNKSERHIRGGEATKRKYLST